MDRWPWTVGRWPHLLHRGPLAVSQLPRTITGQIAQGPPHIGSKADDQGPKTALRATRPPHVPSGARAMFLSNIRQLFVIGFNCLI